MLIAIDGNKGAGKSAFMAMLLQKDHENGVPIVANFKLTFCKYRHFHLLEEIFGMQNCSIGIDEGQKLFDVRRFMSLPPKFCEMVAGDRHDFIKLYATTQNIQHLDKRVRDNIDVLYRVHRIFRFPFSEKTPAMIQLCRADLHEKYFTEAGFVRWKRGKGKFFIISKYKKKLYETHEHIGLAKFVWRMIRKKGKTTLLIVGRSLIERGKKRI